MKKMAVYHYSWLLSVLLFTACSTIKELPSPPEEAELVTSDTDLTAIVLEEKQVNYGNGEIVIEFQLSDTNGIALQLDESAYAMIQVEAMVDGTWQKLNSDDYRFSASSTVHCPPVDYAILLDQSGSMRSVQTLINREVDQFIDYKNDFDHLAIIKYANQAKIANGYLANAKEIRKGLFASDSLGGGTNTPKAYRLFLDSLRASHPNDKLRLILFSDLSGNSGELLQVYMKEAFDAGIRTDRVIYSKMIKRRPFTKKGKERFYKLIQSDYGKTYVIESLGSISSCLKDFMNEECLTSSVHIPVDSLGKYTYRLSLINTSGEAQLESNAEVLSLPDTSSFNKAFSLDTMNLLHIEFATGSADILENSYTELDKVVTFLNNYPHVRIAFHGHTDNQGSYAYNMDLSQRRAQSALEYVHSKGIVLERLSAEGFGYTKPVASNDTPEGRQQNRRTEFVVIKNGE